MKFLRKIINHCKKESPKLYDAVNVALLTAGIALGTWITWWAMYALA